MAEMKKAQAWHAYSPSPCSPRPSPLFAPPCPRRRPSLRTLRFLLLPLRSPALPTFPSPALLSPPPLHSLTLLPPLPCTHFLCPCSPLSPALLSPHPPCPPPLPLFPIPTFTSYPLHSHPSLHHALLEATAAARHREEGLLQPARRWRLLPQAAPPTKHAGQPAASPTLPPRQASHTHAPHPNFGFVVNK